MSAPQSQPATCSCPPQTATPCSTPTSTISPPNVDGPPVAGAPISANNANILADSLGVSPLYRQQDSARWQSAAQVYQSSRAHSPVPFASTQTTTLDMANGAVMCMPPKELSKRVQEEAKNKEARLCRRQRPCHSVGERLRALPIEPRREAVAFQFIL
uniref:Uncharacterized protein n=1 Tax=Steinernema glaseri TaxID=37863 RepID=A0A1I7ZEQ9_9BILA